LSCQDYVRRIEMVGHSEHSDLALLHRFEHGRLGFRGRAINLVAQDHVRENRSRLELKLTMTIRFGEYLCANYVGWHQVRCELDSLEAQAEGIGRCLAHQGFAQTRNTFD